MMLKLLLYLGMFTLLHTQVVCAKERLEKKTGKSRVILTKQYECEPLTPSSPSYSAISHPTTAVAAMAYREIVVASWDSLSICDFNGTVLRSGKHTWGFPTHLYYNADRQRIYFWRASDPHQPSSWRAYALDTNLAVVDSFPVKSFPNWFIKVGMLESNRQADVERILKKIRKIAEDNGSSYAEKDMWRYVSFISKRYVLCGRESGNSHHISGYDLSKKTAFRFDIREDTYSEKDSTTLNSEPCTWPKGVFSNRKLSGGYSGVAISEKEFIIAAFDTFRLVDCFRQILLDEE